MGYQLMAYKLFRPDKLTVERLRKTLRALGLPTRGRKQELVTRVLDALEEAEDGTYNDQFFKVRGGGAVLDCEHYVDVIDNIWYSGMFQYYNILRRVAMRSGGRYPGVNAFLREPPCMMPNTVKLLSEDLEKLKVPLEAAIEAEMNLGPCEDGIPFFTSVHKAIASAAELGYALTGG